MLAENLKKQLALAVKSINWNYAIFWSNTDTQPRVLRWGEGYYNGGIKIKRTNETMDVNSDQIGLQRSEQLRKLYASLKSAEVNSQTQRPSAVISPEDLTDAEWFYLVCMSFEFNIGQGLPGRALANGKPIWLCNALSADSRVFSRSLFAKSASIQTVVCFPFLEGVMELGTIDFVSEDHSLIQWIRSSFLDILDTSVPERSGATFSARNDEGFACVAFNRNALQANRPAQTFTAKGTIGGGASQVQSWQVLGDELSNCGQNSMSSSGSISQAFDNPDKITFVTKSENPTSYCAEDLQESNGPKTTSVDLPSDDQHYQRLLSALLKHSDQLNMGLHFQNVHRESSFVIWNRQGSMDCQRPRRGIPQKLLKKALFEVPRMHVDWLLEAQEERDYREGMRPEVDEIGMNHVLSERKRRAELNERFSTLRSMVPSTTKDDKISILDDAINYLRKLEKKVRELEAQRVLIDLEARTKRTPQDMVERTSDNYCNNKFDSKKKSVVNKRKASDIDEKRRGISSKALKKASASNVTICMRDNEILIEMNCLWRERVLLKIMEAINSLCLDCHSVQSSEADGNLNLTIKSKFRGPNVASAKRIKHTLQKAALKC
ncbi:transcription factor EGL1-like [Abrus precatorius]|uniref:Transcription factor EGL1-like n=1 Tax=Abrus precatorius TaxID=3816 RepID=A0A8B8LW61_ABRPR|nr:transcription factor EGL1-like [Abrus precatorius]